MSVISLAGFSENVVRLKNNRRGAMVSPEKGRLKWAQQTNLSRENFKESIRWK